MTIVKKPVPVSADDFIQAAPDAAAIVTPAGKAAATTPANKRGPNRSQVSVVMPDVLVAEIDEALKKNFMTRSAFLTMAAREALARMN